MKEFSIGDLQVMQRVLSYAKTYSAFPHWEPKQPYEESLRQAADKFEDIKFDVAAFTEMLGEIIKASEHYEQLKKLGI